MQVAAGLRFCSLLQAGHCPRHIRRGSGSATENIIEIARTVARRTHDIGSVTGVARREDIHESGAVRVQGHARRKCGLRAHALPRQTAWVRDRA